MAVRRATVTPIYYLYGGGGGGGGGGNVYRQFQDRYHTDFTKYTNKQELEKK